MLLPILRRGIDINSPDELNLLEDSMLVRLPLCVCVCILVGCFILTCLLNAIAIILQLWEATISHAPVMVPQLLAYFPCLVEIMERSFDHLQVGLH